MLTRRNFLQIGLAVAGSAAVGCGRARGGTALAIGWDPTASTGSSDDRVAEQIERLIAPRYLDGPVAVAHVCTRPQGHLLLAAERPAAARVKEAFAKARQACACGPGSTCGSDVAAMLGVLVDFLSRTSAERRVLLVRSDLVPDPCKVTDRRFASAASVIIPDGIETHVYGVRMEDRGPARLPQSSAPLCLHLPNESVDVRHLRFSAGSAF